MQGTTKTTSIYLLARVVEDVMVVQYEPSFTPVFPQTLTALLR